MKKISVKALVCLFILLFSLTLVLAGCGGDKKPAAPADRKPAPPAEKKPPPTGKKPASTTEKKKQS